MNDRINEMKKHMEKGIEHLRGEFSKMRVGRATVAMLDGVKVEAYGSAVTLKEVAALSVPDARTIAIQPWDRSVIGEIERGILAANLGITPMNDGKIVRLTLPPLTEERRKDYVKQIKKAGEDTKVGVRNTRRDTLDGFKKSKEDGDISEDDLKRTQDEVQKITDNFVAEIDKLVEAKSKEVMTL